VEMAKHVGIVEAEVDAPLFERHGGKWVLNEEGRLFAPKASQSILYARMGLDLVQSHVKLQTNRLFVGYPAGNNPSNRLRE
jgi:DNA-binding transcriptional LysR family regulator